MSSEIRWNLDFVFHLRTVLAHQDESGAKCGMKISEQSEMFIQTISSMSNYMQPSFLRNRLSQIPDAILHCPEQQLCNLETVVASTLCIEDDLQLWLSIDKPVNWAKGGNQSFDVVLNYQSNTIPFDLDILGEAQVVERRGQVATMPLAVQRALEMGSLVLTVKLIDVDYWEPGLTFWKKISRSIRQGLAGRRRGHPNDELPAHRLSA